MSTNRERRLFMTVAVAVIWLFMALLARMVPPFLASLVGRL